MRWQTHELQQAARAAARIDHPSVVRVLDVQTETDPPHLVMAWCQGQTFRELLVRRTLHVTAVVQILAGLLDALASVHEAGLVHRDVKPSNLMVSDRICLLDLGLACDRGHHHLDVSLLTAGGVAGTAAYMAPEALAGAAVDERADVYAVGVMLFEALTGRLPAQERLVVPGQPVAVGRTLSRLFARLCGPIGGRPLAAVARDELRAALVITRGNDSRVRSSNRPAYGEKIATRLRHELRRRKEDEQA
jgi:serine/threonine protein kinase